MITGLKILQVSGGRSPIPPVGAFSPEHCIHGLSTALTESSHEVTLIDARGPRPPVPYRVIEVPSGAQGNVSHPKALARGLFFGLNVRRRLQQLLYHEHFDVVNFHFQFPALFGVPVARLHSVAAVYWAHTPFWGTRHAAWQYTNRVLFWPERHALSVVDKVVVGTQGTARNICMELGLPANRIEVIPYGLPDEWFQPLLEPAIPDSVPWHDDGPLVLTVGVITPRKNQELLMRAIPLVLEQMPEAKFAFAGPIIDRRYAERLQAMAREKGIDGHVRFLGDVPRDALRGLYQASSAFVFTSYAETTGVVLLEAMASRVPILMASAMEVREVVPSDCAMFAPVGDHEALARAIIALLRSREARERLREAGWRYVYGRHRWSEVVGRFVELYRRLAQPNGGDDFGEGGQ